MAHVVHGTILKKILQNKYGYWMENRLIKKIFNVKCKLNWRRGKNIYVRSNFYFQFIYELLSNIFLIFSGTFMFLITLQCLRLKMPFQLIITLPNRIHYCYQMTVAYIYISSGCLCNMTHKMLRMFICVLKQNPYANRVFFFFWNIWNAFFSSLVSVMWCSIFFLSAFLSGV